jgi:glycogen debranching enzyme
VEDVIRVQDHYYILATSSRTDDRTRVLKDGETFAVCDPHGDILPFGMGEQGLYHEGTRFLSRLELRLGKVRPLLLSSTVRENNDLFPVDLTNPDLELDDDVMLPRGLLHLFRSKLLSDGRCFEHLRLSNHGLQPIRVTLLLRFEADYADIFEVRGTRRPARGILLEPEVGADGSVSLRYHGLDGVTRRTRITFEPRPTEVSGSGARFELRLASQEAEAIDVTILCEGTDPRPALSYQDALATVTRAPLDWRAAQCRIETSNDSFNNWISRSLADLHMMMTQTEHGPYPYAGVPWFSTAFGRDGIITALEMLLIDPRVAKGVLTYLAAKQAVDVVPEQDAEPGKILHETRGGEMAALGEIPFGLYYGSVDSTPLFVMLAGAYYRRTGDLEHVRRLWPNIEAALEWTETYGDPDGDGFVEYARRTPRGLAQQGWKDSQDSVFHANGEPADGPIALCEVQGYVFAARRAAADMAEALGDIVRAQELRQKAETLRAQFEDAFWSEDLSTYALALDGEKRPCRVRTSNAGHCLWSGIADIERARRTALTLLSPESFSGWGIRTLAASERRYNPMSYHNGSVWPHDNAVIAAGFAQYGLGEMAVRTMTGLFDSSQFVEMHRLPELFCGFKRRPGEGPTLYPVACSPQSWAAAAVFLLMQSALGLHIDAPRQRVEFTRPHLPAYLDRVQLKNLVVGNGSVDIVLERHDDDVGLVVARRQGRIEIVTMK